MKKRFKIGDRIFNIPETDVSAFLSDNPGAVEVKFYQVADKKYNIPLGETDAFETEMGLKKKEPAGGASSNGSKAGGPFTSTSPLPSNSNGESYIPDDERDRAYELKKTNPRFKYLLDKVFDYGAGTASEIKEFHELRKQNKLNTFYADAGNEVSPDYESNLKAYEKEFGKSFETDPNAYLKQFGQQQGGLPPNNLSVSTGDNISRNINAAAAPLKTSPVVDAETSANPYAPILEVINKARPNDPVTRASLYNQIVSDHESGDAARGKKAKDELLALSNESNPEVITPADKLELVTLTGTDDPVKQLQVLDARLGKTTGDVPAMGSALNPLIDVDLGSLPAADNEMLGVYRDKLAYNLNPGNKKNTKWSAQSVLTKGGQQTTEGENLLNLMSGVAGITNANIEEAKRYNSEKLTDSFSTGLESIKLTDPARYKRNADAITNGKPLSTTDVVDLTAIGTKIIQRENAQGIVDRNITSDEYTATQENLAKDQEQNVYGHPDFLRTIMADVIGKHYEKDGTLLFSKWMVTDKEIDAVPDSEYLAQGIDPNHPEFKKQKEFLKQKEGWFPFQNSIAKDDLFREFRKGAAQPLKGIASTVESVAADIVDAEESLVTDRQTQQFGVGDVANQRGKYFDENYGKWADAFSGFGQFASQLAIMYAGGQAVTAIGEGLGGATAASRLLGASNIRKVGNVLADNAQLYGTYGTSFIQSYGDYFKDALSKGADPLQAKMMAFTNASMEGVSETIFDNVRFGKEVAKNLLDKRNYDKIAKVFDRGVWDDLSQAQYREIVTDVASQTWKTFKKAGGAAVKEAFEEVPVAVGNFVVDAAANPSNVKGRDVLLESKDAFMDGLVSFSIPSLLGLAGGLRQQFASEKTANESLMIAALQQPYVTESINRLVQAGTITQEQANQKLKVVNTAAEQLKTIPKTYADDTEMTQQDQETYLALSVKEKVLENSLQNNDKAAQKIINGKINDILAQKDAILNKSVEDVVKETTQRLPPQEAARVPDEERLDDNEVITFQKVQVSGKKSFTDLFIDPAKPKTSIQALKEQAVDAPNSLLESLNQDQDALTDVIALNDEAAINAGIQKWTDAIVNETHTPEEADAHIALLEEGLAKKQAAATTEGTTKNIKIGEFEKDEMLSMIDNRKDTVEEDPESASGIESKEGALDTLKQKIESGDHNFTKDELAWLKSEADDLVEKTQAAIEADGNPEAKKRLPKVKKFADEINSALDKSSTPQATEVTPIAPIVTTPVQTQQPSRVRVTAEQMQAAQGEVLPGETTTAVIPPASQPATTETRRGVTVTLPQSADRTAVETFSDRVVNAEDLSSPEDQEFYQNNATAIEAELKKRFAIEARAKVPPEFTPEEQTKFSDALFAFADKILKADPTGSGGGAAMTNFFKIPQELLGRAIQAVALAVKAGESLASAIKKGMAVFAEDEDVFVDEDDFTGLIKSLQAGGKPKMGRQYTKSFATMAGVPSDKEYAVAMDGNESADPIAAYHMTRAAELPKMFGADKTQQNVFDSQPSEERFRAQMDMIQDGKNLMAAAQSMFGSTDVLVYGPQLLAYINRGKEIDAGLTNKRAVMLATLLGEVKQDLLTNKNPDRQDALQQFDRRLSTVYNQFMHVTAKNLSAARLLRVFRDKYMADIFHDKILEDEQIRERNNITEEEADVEISDQDALAHQEKPRDKPDIKGQAQERKKKQAEADSRKKSPRNEFEKKASELEDDIKKKYGGKNKLIENVIERIKKLNCK